MEYCVMRMLRGYVRIRIYGSSYDRFLNLCAYHQITLWDLQPVDEAYEANLLRSDFKKLRAIVRKTRISVQIVRKRGLPFFLHRYRKRKVSVMGIGAAFLLLLWMSSHIWLISVEGNHALTDDVMFEYLSENGIMHGMRKSKVNCRELAQEIRNHFGEFTWVAVKLSGTHLIISVKEGILQESDGEEIENKAESLIAAESGVIEKIYVRSGCPMVKEGEKVTTGTLLVSGKLPVYDDSGEVKSWQYVKADADIIIRTVLAYQDKVPYCYEEKCYTGKKRTKHLLEIGKIPFGICLPGKKWKQYDRICTVKQAKLFEHFYLPFYLETTVEKQYERIEKRRTEEEAEKKLQKNFENFKKNLEEKGVQIFENNVRIEWQKEFCRAAGELVVGKPAYQRVPEEETQLLETE